MVAWVGEASQVFNFSLSLLDVLQVPELSSLMMC